VSRLRLSLGCWNYDRTRGLLEGRIQPDGIELTYLNMPVEETFFRMLRHQEFDVAEMSLSSYAVSLCKEKKNFIAIPVFPSRFFRHSCVYVNAKSGIREPKDLIGKRSAIPSTR
jgi:4,5-dihydroxyphthalate decarboxylase